MSIKITWKIFSSLISGAKKTIPKYSLSEETEIPITFYILIKCKTPSPSLAEYLMCRTEKLA